MNKIYYSALTKKDYIGLIFNIIGLVTIPFCSYYISILLIIIAVYCYNGDFNYDFFVEDKNTLYLVSKNKKMYLPVFNLILLFVSFCLCINNLYEYSIILLNLVLLELNIINIFRNIKNKKFCTNKENIENLLSKRNFSYFVHEIYDVEDYKDSRFYTSLVDKFDKNSRFSTYYKLNKGISDYREIFEKLNCKMRKSK